MKNKLNWLEAFLVIAPFLILIAFWNQIPQRVPLHWNVDNQIDRWGSKSSSMFLLPLISLATVALLHVVPWLDPKLRRQRSAGREAATDLPAHAVAANAAADDGWAIRADCPKRSRRLRQHRQHRL